MEIWQYKRLTDENSIKQEIQNLVTEIQGLYDDIVKNDPGLIMEKIRN